MNVEYEGVDITESVIVKRCWIDQYIERHGDTIKIIFDDTKKLWDKWSPKIGDRIRVYDKHVDSGIQYIRGLYPTTSGYEIQSSSIPKSAFVTRRKGWQQVTKLQLARDIAIRHGLELMTYGIDDHKFYYLRQDNENDLGLLCRILTLEGDAFLIYDNKLVVYSETYIESMPTRQTIVASSSNKIEYKDEQTVTALSIRNDTMEYTYGSNLSCPKNVNVEMYIDSQGTAERYAKNLYHHYNKMKRSGTLYTSPITDGYSAGSVVMLETEGLESFNNKILMYHLRHDMTRNKTKIFFRCL